jgi:hypothetical protein
MHKIKSHRVVRPGDMFYIPYNYEAKFGEDGEGIYHPKPDDVGAFGQVVYTSSIWAMHVALFSGECIFDKVDTQLAAEASKKEVKALVTTTTKSLKKGWFPFVDNVKIADDMPFQIYRTLQNDFLTIDNQRLSVDDRTKQYLQAGVHFSTQSTIDIARYINGYPTDMSVEIDEVTPLKHALAQRKPISK